MKKIVTIAPTLIAAFAALAVFAVTALTTSCEEPDIIMLPETTAENSSDWAFYDGVDVLDEIADPAFRTYCDGRMGEWDGNGDGFLSEDEAAAVAVINIGHSFGYKGDKVRSLEGIEYFKGLVSLYCDGHRLKEVDLSANRALRLLWCLDNPGKRAAFVVRSWFDGDTTPEGTLITNSWKVGGKTVEVEFRGRNRD